MFIKRIVLNGFKRFALKGVTHFELEPKGKLIIFTDKNGVGKSSLMSQLNPLPAELKKDFSAGGYKIIELEHNNKNYVITSKDNKHSIIEDGVELNPGGTKRVQQEIVESIFKINNNTLNVINGVNRFTIMSPSERKQWLTKISTIDYTYPIQIFNKIAERKRDISAWLKLSTEKIVSLKTFLETNVNIENLVKREKELQDTIEELLKRYNKLDRSCSYTDVIDRLQNLNRVMRTLDVEDSVDIDTVVKSIEEIKIKVSYLSSVRDDSYKEFEKIEKSIDNELVENIKINIDKIEEELKSYPFKDYSTLDTDLNTLNNLAYYLEDIFNKVKNIEVNTDKTLTELKYELESLNNKLMNLKTSLTATLSLAGVSKSMVDSGHGGIDCGHCGKPVDFLKVFEEKKEKSDKLKEEIEELEKEIDATKKNINTLENLKSLEDKASYIFNHSKDLFLSLGIKEITPFNSSQVLNMVNITNSRLVEFYKPRIEALCKLKEAYKESEIRNKMSKALKEKEKDAVRLKIESITRDINNLNQVLKNLLEVKSKFERLSEIRKQTTSELSKLTSIKKNLMMEHENRLIEKLITSAKEELVSISQSLERYRTSLKTLEEERKNTVMYDRQIKNLSILLQILSPSSGLIAKSINSFLGVIINEMNSIINSVWSYKMKLLPCDLGEGEDLDYKFKVEVNDDFIVEDISKLSSSMQEIVDLSFRLVFIRYLNVGDVPIILDEFGRAMDRDHRINAFNMVDQVISHSFDQIFLVSHFEEMYGRFKNAHFASIE